MMMTIRKRKFHDRKKVDTTIKIIKKVCKYSYQNWISRTHNKYDYDYILFGFPSIYTYYISVGPNYFIFHKQKSL